MPIPHLSITVYDPGASGVPTTSNPRNLARWADTYDDSLANEFGCETLRLTGRVRSIEAAIDWTQQLMAAVEVDTPSGNTRFRGFLHEVQIPALECSVSLTDMANAVIVRWRDPDGNQGSVTATNAQSIARYGRKELVLNLSTAYAAEATNRATMVLNQVAFPPNKETVSAGASSDTIGHGPFEVVLIFRGWAETLKWLTTSNTTTATAVTSTQATGLITTYNSTNNFFDTTNASVTSTGFSATQYCDPDTTIYERIAMLLAAGNSSQQRVAWGFYTRAITIATSASADPGTVQYTYSKRDKQLRDAYGNVIPPWDWRPDTMIQNVDLIEPQAATLQIATLTRKYVKRVTLRIGRDGVASGTLEADDPETLPEMLAKPVSVTAGISSRHAQIEARINRAARVRSVTTDRGNIQNTGGGNVDLGTGTGIGGSGTSAALGTGTAGRVAEWLSSSTLQASTLIKSGAGVLTLSASSTYTLTISGSINLSGTGATSGQALVYDGTKFAPTTLASTDLSNFNEAVDDRVAALIIDSSSVVWTYNDAANTLSAAVTNEAIDDRVSALLVAGTNVSLTYNDAANTLTIATSGVVTGSGTAGRIAQWNTSTDLEASTLIKSGAGVLTLSAASAYTLTVPKTGTAVVGTGTAGRITEWVTDANTVQASTLIKSGSGVLTLSCSTTETLTITDGGTLDLNGFTLTMPASGTVLISVGGGANRMAYFTSTYALEQASTIYVSDSPTRLGIGVTGTHSLQLGDDDAAKTTTTTWTTTSDRRTKTLLRPYTRGLDLLCALPPIWEYEENGRFGTTEGTRGINFVAQEVETVAPSWISRRPHKEYVDDPDGSEVDILKLNTHEHIYALHNTVLAIARHLGLTETPHGL